MERISESNNSSEQAEQKNASIKTNTLASFLRIVIPMQFYLPKQDVGCLMIAAGMPVAAGPPDGAIDCAMPS
ncbi:MAG: hypothetical protein LBQ32_01060 [Burkholderiaceae bacterium]|nr:hypothetical protein [Burkholderiaceae bacterium]